MKLQHSLGMLTAAALALATAGCGGDPSPRSGGPDSPAGGNRRLNKWSAEQDRTGDVRLKTRMSSSPRLGTVLWALTWSWAMFDWVMSLEPTWFSTIYGFLFIVIECLAALAFSILIVRTLYEYEPVQKLHRTGEA